MRQRWISLGGFQFQPSELMKLATVIYAADYTARKAHLMQSFRKGLLPLASVMVPIGVLLLLQPDYGATIVVKNLDDAVPLADAIAAEHLEIETHDAERLAGKIRNAGAIFLGAYSPEAIGDYVAGSNHVLPTARSARFSSGLGVLDFMKRTSILKCGPDQLASLGPSAIALGEAEGLDAHARSVAIRLNRR